MLAGSICSTVPASDGRLSVQSGGARREERAQRGIAYRPPARPKPFEKVFYRNNPGTDQYPTALRFEQFGNFDQAGACRTPYPGQFGKIDHNPLCSLKTKVNDPIMEASGVCIVHNAGKIDQAHFADYGDL